MFKTLLAATALIATVSPAFAGQSAPRTFTRDGETYTYTATDLGDHVVLDGTRRSNGERFTLDVRGNRISGTTGGVPVSFTMPNAQARLVGTAIAAR